VRKSLVLAQKPFNASSDHYVKKYIKDVLRHILSMLEPEFNDR
jgi:hypothetical protein